MCSRVTLNSPSRQKGLVLVVLIIIIALAFISYIVSELSLPEVKFKQDEKTMASLKKAKQSLLAYAMNYPDTLPPPKSLITQGPGNMPCPDSEDVDGISNTGGGLPVACLSTGNGTLGRFPWETVQSDELRDGDNELLWYAVSSNFVNVGVRVLNTSTRGQITLRRSDGTIQFNGANRDAIVAVIIAPGEKLVRDDGLVQSRTTAAEVADPKNYLDIANGEDNADFVNLNPDGFILGVVRNAANDIIVNDRIITITYEEVMSLAHAKAASEIALAITEYANVGVGNCVDYPEASTFDPTQAKADGTYTSDPGVNEGHLPVDSADWAPGGCADGLLPGWVEAEEWHKQSYYERSATTAPCLPADCITISNTNPAISDAEAIILFAGREQAGQPRDTPGSDFDDYFENENNDNDGAFDELIYDSDETDDYVLKIAP